MMECDLSIVPGKRMVISRFTGPIETDDRYRNRDRTLSFCRENNISKIIVDTRGQISGSTSTEIYKFGEELVAEASGLDIAFVRDPDSQDIRFMDNVAANRGCFCKSFTSFEEAERWLELNDKSPNKANAVDGN